MTVPQVVRFELAGGPVTVRHELDGPRLHLVVERHDEARELVAHVARPTALVVRWLGPHGFTPGTTQRSPDRFDKGTEAGWWPIGSRFGWGGSFESLANFAARPRRERDERLQPGEDGHEPDANPRFRAAETACRAHLRAIARTLHERLDPEALRVARAFRQAQRWWFYAAALDDPTGRVAQLASTCPGALILARDHASAFEWCGRPDHDRAARQILEDAVAGIPLRHLVARAAERWVAVPATNPAGPLRRALSMTSPADRPALFARQRLLVRRAGPWVRCADLARPGLVTFAPEDIPCSPVENMRWYFATSLAAEALALGPAGPREALSRFVSRNSLLLYGWAHRAIQLRHHARAERALDMVVFRLATYCDTTGRRPTRRSDPIAFLEASERWHEAAEPARRLEALLDRVRKLGLGEVTCVRTLGGGSFLRRVAGLPYPRPPDGPPEIDLVVEPIRSQSELEREGTRMNHCVADLLPEVVAGEVFVYSVRSGPRRYTLAVAARADGRLHVQELRGRSNEAVPLHVWRRVVRWVDRLGPAQ